MSYYKNLTSLSRFNRNDYNQPPRIVCIGDSTTESLSTLTLDTVTYPYSLGQIYPYPSVQESWYGWRRRDDRLKYDPTFWTKAPGSWTLGGWLFKGTNCSVLTYGTLTPVDTFEVVLLCRSDVDNVNLQIDGEELITVNCTDSNATIGYLKKFVIQTNVEACHTFKISSYTAAGTIYLVGLESYSKNKKYGRIIMAGQSGATTNNLVGSSGNDQKESVYSIIGTLSFIKPSLVVLMMGINDYFQLSFDNFSANMNYLLQNIQPICDVLLMTFVPSSVTVSIPQSKIISFNDLTRSLSDTYNITLLDLNRIFIDWNTANQNGFFQDILHPSSMGYLEIAKLIVAVIDKSIVNYGT